jgi:hypothetical protein
MVPNKPYKAKNDLKIHKVTAYFSEAEKALLSEIARAEGLTVSKLVYKTMIAAFCRENNH